MLHRNLSFSLLLALAVFVLGFAVRLAPVKASFPGANGKIAFSRFTLGGPNQGIFTMNSDGSMQTNLTNPPNADQLPAWSPDGAKLAFGRSGGIYVMNSDGTIAHN